jgi:hypothetical protein
MSKRLSITQDGSCLRLLDVIYRMAKSKSHIDASIISTYSVNLHFYENVLLRFLERAGSRLNILLVDSGQLSTALADPIHRPMRAGSDYILVPIQSPGAFHPKVMALLGEQRSLLAIGSHNITEAGFGRNGEATVCWGHDGNNVPFDVMTDAFEFLKHWMHKARGFNPDVLEDVWQRIDHLGTRATGEADRESQFLGWQQSGRSLLEQMQEEITGTVERIVIVGPYFDANLKFINAVDQIWAPREIVIGIQPKRSLVLTPENKPQSAKFVDVDDLPVFKAQGQGAFLHGKALAVVGSEGVWLALGSANPSAPAWMQTNSGNSEAMVLLSGAAAQDAYERLGFAALANAAMLSEEVLDEVRTRSQEAREHEAEHEFQKGPAIHLGFSDRDGITVAGIDASICEDVFIIVEEREKLIDNVEFQPIEGGLRIFAEDIAESSGLLRIDGIQGPVAFVLVHTKQRISASIRPIKSAHLLERLGKLDELEDDLDDLLDLLDRHIFSSDEQEVDNRHQSGRKKQGSDESEDVPFGPRGISLAEVAWHQPKRQKIVDLELSYIISILIRDLSEPKALDGDTPIIDPDDVEGEEGASTDGDRGEAPPEVDWDRLSAAGRKRIGTLVNKLAIHLNKKPDNTEQAAKQFGRMLTVLSLLQKLRKIYPREDIPIRTIGRPKSIVSLTHLRKAFKSSVSALYRSDNGLAGVLEKSADHRNAEERDLVDGLLLWAAREIGADAAAKPGFHESEDENMQRISDQADCLIVTMSAAASERAMAMVRDHIAETALWADGETPLMDWFQRHEKLGTALQKAISMNGSIVPIVSRQPVSGDVAIWKKEPGFPRIVRSTSSNRTELVEPGDENGQHSKKLATVAVLPINLEALNAISDLKEKAKLVTLGQ